MFGSKWALIASHLDGRTENSVKNFFYSDQRKTLRRDKKKIRKELERLNVFEPNHSLKSKRELNIPTFLMENSNFNNQVIESLESSFDAPSISFSFNFNPYLYDQNCFLIDFKNNENLDFQVYAFSEV